MSAKSATLAKSLHTVSALVSVARHVTATARQSGRFLVPSDAVNLAASILGYNMVSGGASDPYGLVPRAVAILAKDAPAAEPRAPRPMSGAAAYDAGRI